MTQYRGRLSALTQPLCLKPEPESKRNKLKTATLPLSEKPLNALGDSKIVYNGKTVEVEVDPMRTIMGMSLLDLIGCKVK